ncbi:hypothetical protein [Longimicrobium sp.]|uniref:hypothetical protein n=1 Tax=Longimicrobium sp. TaxID=2029185 RepID=UPI002E3742FE|nr:hypothetical protein [Longimicrobium sp.]HEX6041357.1 hypothetical protein [Longimicrobium sp.]
MASDEIGKEQELRLLGALRDALTRLGIGAQISEELPGLSIGTAIPGVCVWVFVSASGRTFTWRRGDSKHPTTDVTGAAAEVAKYVSRQRGGWPARHFNPFGWPSGGEAMPPRRRSRFERWEWAMGFDRARFEAANVRVAFGPRRLHLAALDAVLCGRRELACGIVARGGVPMLNVVAMGAAHRPVEVGCDHLDGAWSFTWADTGRTIGPVDDPVTVADRVAAALAGNGAAR